MTKQRSELAVGAASSSEMSAPVQLAFGIPGFEGVRPKPHRRRTHHRDRAQSSPLMDVLTRRVSSHYSPTTAKKYMWCVEDVLAVAGADDGEMLVLEEILQYPEMLGRALASDCRRGGGRPLSAWTVANRRSAMRGAVGLLAPELGSMGVTDPVALVNDALRQVAEPIGGGFRLPSGLPRRRGGPTPSRQEFEAIVRELAAVPGWRGMRNELFFRLLASRGVRVNALRELDGRNLFLQDDGSMRMIVHAKSARRAAEYELTSAERERIESYCAAFNTWAKAHGFHERIEVGRAGMLWRGDSGRPWAYTAVARTLTNACTRGGVSRITPHALRRYFASEASLVVPRDLAALAGGWRSTRRMDDHYVGRHDEDLLVHLQQLSLRSTHASPPSQPIPAPSQPERVY